VRLVWGEGLKIFPAALRVALVWCVANSLGVVCRADNERHLPSAPTPPTQGLTSPLKLRLPSSVLVVQDAASQISAQGPKSVSAGWSEHKFWDRENMALFAAVGGSRALDYSSTLNMRRRGRQEVFLTNEIVDNHPAFAAIEAGGTAISIGASYLFHRYHYHRLEHWTSIVHASLTTAGAVRNYSLKTAHP
jgi:hypothetical protein